MTAASCTLDSERTGSSTKLHPPVANVAHPVVLRLLPTHGDVAPLPVAIGLSPAKYCAGGQTSPQEGGARLERGPGFGGGKIWTIGSHPQCTVVLPELAPVHAVVVQGRSRTVVRRWLGPTWINGVPVDDACLHPGDVLRVGTTRWVAEAEAPAPTGHVMNEPSRQRQAATRLPADQLEWLQTQLLVAMDDYGTAPSCQKQPAASAQQGREIGRLQTAGGRFRSFPTADRHKKAKRRAAAVARQTKKSSEADPASMLSGSADTSPYPLRTAAHPNNRPNDPVGASFASTDSACRLPDTLVVGPIDSASTRGTIETQLEQSLAQVYQQVEQLHRDLAAVTRQQTCLNESYAQLARQTTELVHRMQRQEPHPRHDADQTTAAFDRLERVESFAAQLDQQHQALVSDYQRLQEAIESLRQDCENVALRLQQLEKSVGDVGHLRQRWLQAEETHRQHECELRELANQLRALEISWAESEPTHAQSVHSLVDTHREQLHRVAGGGISATDGQRCPAGCDTVVGEEQTRTLEHPPVQAAPLPSDVQPQRDQWQDGSDAVLAQTGCQEAPVTQVGDIDQPGPVGRALSEAGTRPDREPSEAQDAPALEEPAYDESPQDVIRRLSQMGLWRQVAVDEDDRAGTNQDTTISAIESSEDVPPYHEQVPPISTEAGPNGFAVLGATDDSDSDAELVTAVSESFLARRDDGQEVGECIQGQAGQVENLAGTETAEVGEESGQRASPYAPEPGEHSVENADDCELAIQEYMARLLGRLKSDAPLTWTGPTDSGPAKAPPVGGSDTPATEPTTPISPEAYTPRSQAPERHADLRAMRELALHSARSALQTHAKRSVQEKTRKLLRYAGVAAVVSGACWILPTNNWSWLQDLIGVSSLVVAVAMFVAAWVTRMRASFIHRD